MQLITWSANLHSVVRNLKELDAATLRLRMNDKAYLDTLSLTSIEKKTLIQAFLECESTGIRADWD